LFVASSSAAAASETEVLEKANAAFVAAAKRVLPGVVSITTKKKPIADPNTEDLSLENLIDPVEGESAEAVLEALRQARQAVGARGSEQSSGFLVSATGLIVTASHVVEDVDEILVRLHDGQEWEAKLLGADPMSQVAVLKIDGENLPVLKLGDSSKLEVGQWVMTAGHPFGLRTTIGFGILGAVGVRGLGTAAFEDYIQTDAAMQPGCSGGPLLNVRGEVIGMNVAVAGRNGPLPGVGFAVPINMIKAVKDQLAASGQMVYSYLGVAIQDLDREMADSLGLDKPRGVRVGSVMAGTPAAEAGLAEGDVVLEMDGKVVADTAWLIKSVAFTTPGTRVTLTILREGEKKDVNAKLVPRPGGD
jgi:serine protease Do